MIGRIGTAGGTGYVIEYAGEAIAGAVDGRAHDALQPDHRGRRARRAGGAGRDHLRLSDGPSRRAQGRRLGDGAELLEELLLRSGRPVRPRGADRRRGAEAHRHLGHQPRGRGRRSTAACPIPADFDEREGRRRCAARWTTWAWSPASRSPRRGSTGCSSARAPTAASRTCAPPPPSPRGAHGGAPHVDAMVVPGSGLVKDQAEAEGLDEVFRAAGFDWREPGCSMCLAHEPRQAGSRASAAPRPPTAISRAARAAAAAPT